MVDKLAARILAAASPLLSEPRADAGAGTGARADADEFEATRARLKFIRNKAVPEPWRAKVANDAAAHVNTANRAEFKRIFRIDLPKTQPGIVPALDKFRAENIDLITSIEHDLLDQVDALISEHWAKGARVETIRRELQERFDVTKSRADLIARDQVLKLNAQITKTRQESAGISEYVWTTSGDERVRGNPDGKYPDSDRDHWRLDGKRFRWDSPPVINEKTGERAHPGEDFQCRCVAMPVLSFLEDPETE